jgi:hypothetical protein
MAAHAARSLQKRPRARQAHDFFCLHAGGGGELSSRATLRSIARFFSGLKIGGAPGSRAVRIRTTRRFAKMRAHNARA